MLAGLPLDAIETSERSTTGRHASDGLARRYFMLALM